MLESNPPKSTVLVRRLAVRLKMEASRTTTKKAATNTETRPIQIRLSKDIQAYNDGAPNRGLLNTPTIRHETEASRTYASSFEGLAAGQMLRVPLATGSQESHVQSKTNTNE